MARAIEAATVAAQAGDAQAFADANAELAGVDRAQLLVLLGAVTREVLERSHPDGLDSEDAEQALQSCIRFAAGWYAELDSDPLIRALTGALGVGEPAEEPAIDELALVAHGLLLICDQLVTSGQELAPLLDEALGELMRAQTIELP